MVEVDARGLLCPQPLIEARKALQPAEVKQIRVLVDDATALENICRFGRSQGCAVEVETAGVEHHITITRGE